MAANPLDRVTFVNTRKTSAPQAAVNINVLANLQRSINEFIQDKFYITVIVIPSLCRERIHSKLSDSYPVSVYGSD